MVKLFLDILQNVSQLLYLLFGIIVCILYSPVISIFPFITGVAFCLKFQQSFVVSSLTYFPLAPKYLLFFHIQGMQAVLQILSCRRNLVRFNP